MIYFKLVLLAQLVEHLTFNQRVRGSNPLQDTTYDADVAELADALDLGSSTFGVQVQLLSSAPKMNLMAIMIKLRKPHD